MPDNELPERIDVAINNLLRAILRFDVDEVETALLEASKLAPVRDLATFCVAQARVLSEDHAEQFEQARIVLGIPSSEPSKH